MPGQVLDHPVRVGVGGWQFEPWRGVFYPPGLAQKNELKYASRKLTAIEVNATYYSTFKPDTFQKWAEETPEDFVFSLKAHRFTTVRKTRADMQSSVDLFLGSGVTALGRRLGPINWQFPETRKFDADYFDTFLSVLPKEKDGLRLRHALEVRGMGFDSPQFLDLLTRYGATVVYADDADFPRLRHEGADFAIARLMRSQSDEPAGYPAADIAAFARLFKGWSAKQDVFAFFISGAKERNPAAALALQDKLGIKPVGSGDADALAGAAAKPSALAMPRKAPAKKSPAGKTSPSGKTSPAGKK
jgi:uncharacterized protein YecE (DUF72 family)